MGTQLLALLNALAAEFSIDTNRISVTGLSIGGYGVWSLLQQYPAFFSAAVPICGGGNPALAASFRDVPVWNFHAGNDDLVPVERVPLHDLGVAPGGWKAALHGVRQRRACELDGGLSKSIRRRVDLRPETR